MYLQDALSCSRVKMAIHTDGNGIEMLVQLKMKDGFSILIKPENVYSDKEYTMGVCFWLSDKWMPILP